VFPYIVSAFPSAGLFYFARAAVEKKGEMEEFAEIITEGIAALTGKQREVI
jgi:hypothetical protein